MGSRIFNNTPGRRNVSGIDYSAITNMEQLRAARSHIAHLAELKERELIAGGQAVKDALNPITYINRFITKLYSMEYVIKFAMKGYDFIKGFFKKEQHPDSKSPDYNNAEEASAVEQPVEDEAGNNEEADVKE